MLRSLWRSATPIVALAVFGIATAVQAATVNYTTVGHFGAPAGPSVVAVGANSVTYNGEVAGSVDTDIINPTAAGFGQFVTLGTDPAQTFNVPFFLDILQSLPSTSSPNPQVLLATLAGQLAFNGSSLNLTFTTSTAAFVGVIPQVNTLYTVNNLFNIAPNQTTTLQGTIGTTVVPLPPAVWAGLSLMGLMGVKGFRRQRLVKAGE